MNGNDKTKPGLAGPLLRSAGERCANARPLLSRRFAATLGLLVLWLAVGKATAQAPQYRWEHKYTERGVALYTSTVATHSFAAVKGVATLPLGAESLLATLYDFERYPTWYRRCADVKVLSAPASAPPSPPERDGQLGRIASGGPWVLYFRQQAPPLEDRWAILSCSYRAGSNRTLLIEFKSITSTAFKAPEKLVRMRLYGYWELKPIDPSHTQVTFVLDVDPQTSAAGFLVNPVLKDTVFETVLGLGRSASRARR